MDASRDDDLIDWIGAGWEGEGGDDTYRLD